MTLTPTALRFEVDFSARWWSFISSTRVFASMFCGHWSQDAELSDKVSLAVHELLENAVKYSADPDGLVHVGVHVEDERLRVRVVNRAEPAHIAILRDEFSAIGQGDPLETYITKMQASLESDQARLGLSRIRFESDAELVLAIEETEVVVEARFRLPVAVS